ncbi:hypothetical protein ETD86_23745 [Nonomuraea turkmeniaca]|uniref:Divalent-cation tolerance protein CutA n=1 Tax=Nonomuraea turkmeniaca TaxID=103838 RepID=A0A5S4FEV3_9ACTN|nr:hypothetical protein [Nonomuraea turkmeniaca]TMR17070.1 hypothetical protein ETD86_23745 [Nonomuraea turkmeniaca]
MARLIEVRATIAGRTKAAAIANGILRAGLATSIDIEQVPHPSISAWQLTLITTVQHAETLEQHIRGSGEVGPIVSRPVAHDVDDYPDWLTNQS